MAVISRLAVYPVKSCAGLWLESAEVGRAGLESQGIADREWMVVDASGEFLTQRQHPRMARIVPRVEAGALVLAAPGMGDLTIALGDFSLRAANLNVQVWNHACAAFDEGAEAADWLSAYLGTPARLARFDPAQVRTSNRSITGAIEALNRFSDGYPLLVLSEASLDHLNNRLQQAGRSPLPMDRFRPNLVIKNVEAHDEDRFTALRATADGTQIELRPVKPCPRCPIPSIDQATGERGPDPLDILTQYRGSAHGVLFGQNAVVAHGFGAQLRVGQTLEEEWNF